MLYIDKLRPLFLYFLVQLYNYINVVRRVIVVHRTSCTDVEKNIVRCFRKFTIGVLYLHIFIMYTRRQAEGVAAVAAQRHPESCVQGIYTRQAVACGQVATVVFTITSRAYVYIYIYI